MPPPGATVSPSDLACICCRFAGSEIPEVLEFQSWWNEEGPSRLDHPPGPGTTVRQLNAQTGHGTKHTMTIFYFTMEQLFQIHIGACKLPSRSTRAFLCLSLARAHRSMPQMIPRSHSRLPSRDQMVPAWRCVAWAAIPDVLFLCGCSVMIPPLIFVVDAAAVGSVRRGAAGRTRPADDADEGVVRNDDLARPAGGLDDAAD